MTAPTRGLSRRTIATYAIGSLGTGGFATLPGLVLIYFMTDTLGIAALAAGLLVTLAKVWDVIIDPVIGARSDRSLAVVGTRRRFMVLGAVTLPVFFVATFAVPAGLDPLIAGGWVFVAFVLAATSFSLFQVPYIALPAELTSSYHERTRLITWRVVVLTVAILLFGAGGPALRSLGGDDPHLGYLLMAIVAALLIGGGLFASAFAAPKGIPVDAPSASILANYRVSLDALRRSQPFRALLGTFALQGLATGLMLAGAQYVATWVLKSEDAVTLIFVALIAPALIFTPVWQRIAGRLGKERAFLIASSLYGIAALAMLGLVWAPGPWVYLPVALAGAAYAGMQSLPLAMLPDVISHDAARRGAAGDIAGSTRGVGAAGTFGGVWTAGETTGMAFGATVLTIILAATGYAEATAGSIVWQTDTAVTGIVLSFSIVPAVIIALSLWTFSRYPLRKADIDGLPSGAGSGGSAAPDTKGSVA
jgi:Na+/melibiose symporter-like transporter